MVTASKYAKETGWALAAKASAFLFYYGLVYYLTRRMTVEVWGAWSAFFALLNIVLLVSDQGLNVAVKRYISEARATPQLGGVVRATLLLRIVASVLFTGVIALLIGPLLNWLGQPGYVALMQRSLLLIGFYGVMEYFKYLFEALHRLSFTFVVTALEHGLKFLFVIALFQGADPFPGIVNGFTLAVTLALIAGAIITFCMIPGVLTSAAPLRLMRQAYLYSLPVFLMSIAGFVSLEIDTLMLKALRSDYETGIYSAAKQIIMFLPHIALIFTMGTIPGLAVFQDSAGAQAQRQLYYRILGLLAVVYSVVCLGIVAIALWGMPLIFPLAYAGASIPLLALIPFALLNAAIVFSGSLMVYRGLAWQRSLNVVLTVVANVLLNFWLIPTWGALGAAVASSLAYIPYCILNLRAAHRAFAMPVAHN